MSKTLYIATMALILGLFGTYLFSFLRRAGKLCFSGVKSKYITLCAVLSSAILIISAMVARGTLLLIILFITVLGLITDLANLIIKRIAKTMRKEPKMWKNIHSLGIIPLIITAAVMITGYINMTNIRRTDYTVETAKLSSDYHVAFVSDLHFGTTMDTKKLQEIANEISAASPDMLILGGDITDESTEKSQIQEAFQILGSIKTTYGSFYVYGNHDRQSYSDRKHFTDKELSNAMEAAGITILNDKLYTVNDEILLIGREDAGGSGGQRKKLGELVSDTFNTSGAADSLFRLVLDHQPIETEEYMTYPCDLQLSGHTHNGQIWPAGYISALSNDVLYGQETVGSCQVIVSSGIAGWGFPIRTEGHSEWVMVTLRAQA